jgi:hypothetical protein
MKEEEFQNARLELQSERKKRCIAEAARDRARADHVALERRFDDGLSAGNEFSAPHGPLSADTLLATTLSL